MEKHTFIYNEPFRLEAGGVLPSIEITYHTAGTLTKNCKVLWICHALTANSDAEDWWDGLVGDGKFYNSNEYFIICANVPGSCYGTTGPLSVNPETDEPYYSAFPEVTVRDMVAAHELLRQHLLIEKIHTLIGGSIGGHQAIEWAVSNPSLIGHLVIIASNARVTPWGTAFNEAQRMAIFADKSYYDNTPDGGLDGMKAARAMALISYRSYQGYNLTQPEPDDDALFADRAASYQRYQGQKLAQRFNAYSYVSMSKAVDSHNVGRNRGGVEAALGRITAKTLFIAIDSDYLFLPEEMQYAQRHTPNARYVEISSAFGHDGFLLEWKQIQSVIGNFYRS